MRYTLTQKYVSLRDGFTVTDEYGAPAFRVRGKIISFGKKLYLSDANGREIFFIKQRLFRWFARFDFFSNGKLVTYIKRRPSMFCKRFKIETPYGMWKVKGAWHSFNFRIVDGNDNELALISKRFLRIADTYTIDVADPRNTAFVMAIGLVMDAVYHRRH